MQPQPATAFHIILFTLFGKKSISKKYELNMSIISLPVQGVTLSTENLRRVAGHISKLIVGV